MTSRDTPHREEKLEIGVETGIHWRCMKCDHRQPFDTPDGNEEWKFHCDDPMRMQPTWQLYGVRS